MSQTITFRCPRRECGKLLEARPDTPTQCPSCRNWWTINKDGDRRALEPDEIPSRVDDAQDDEEPAPEQDPKPARKPIAERVAQKKPEAKPMPKPPTKLTDDEIVEGVAEYRRRNNRWPKPIHLADFIGGSESGLRSRLQALVDQGRLASERENTGKRSPQLFMIPSAATKKPSVRAPRAQIASGGVIAEDPAVRSSLADELDVLEKLFDIAAKAEGVGEAFLNFLALTDESRKQIAEKVAGDERMAKKP